MHVRVVYAGNYGATAEIDSFRPRTSESLDLDGFVRGDDALAGVSLMLPHMDVPNRW